ncbi:hypothetical protein SAY86_014644 [Trapa natans]|uniref:Pentatricopeptide repeat-containing protein n=1 Tax=Trapa natans TaxID=22666 RepID=A0AAN7QGV5_TRANT|nr:hypothetical protein SAY86_014644 [Trapa natans]
MFLHIHSLLLEISKLKQTISRTKQLHALVIKLQFSDDPFYATKIVRLYGLNGHLNYAANVFKQCSDKSVFLWNSIIRAYARACRFDGAFLMFSAMLQSETRPDCFSYACLIRASCESCCADGLRLLHCKTVVSGLGWDLICNSALVMAYSKQGQVEEAARIFHAIPDPDLVMWNSMIFGYSCCGMWKQALQMFAQMRSLGKKPDGYSIVGLISGLIGSDSIHIAGAMHAFCLKTSLASTHVGSALINMYARCGFIDSAEKVFGDLVNLDLVTWSALITGYSQCNESEKAVLCFRKMVSVEGGNLDPVLIASILAAAARLANRRTGMEMHASVIRSGLVWNVMVSSALMDMYAKCGMLGFARRVFEIMPEKNIVSYNSIIQALGLHGLAFKSFNVFHEMLNAGVEPDGGTFSALLCACCHAGLVNDGREIFTRMEKEFHVHPEVEHYVHMVKLLGMAGEFEEAYRMVDSLPELVDPGIWGALLSCCEVHGNSEMAELSAQKLFKSASARKSAYGVMLSKVYAGDGRWRDANELRDEMAVSGLRKRPGLSWIGS